MSLTAATPAGARAFLKMHGLGNDFVVIDARSAPFAIDEARARAIADRRFGVGCDQLIVLRAPQSDAAEVFMQIVNADGGEVEACGNATRCVAALVMDETGRPAANIQTVAGLLIGRAASNDRVTVDMGQARFDDWRTIPLARECDTLHLPLALGPLADPVATSMGNPHATFFVDDLAGIDMTGLGPVLEHDPLFPQRANIGVVQVLAPDHLRLRVWERGSGLTLACGSGACAAMVAAARRGLTGRRATIDMDGGTLEMEWLENGHVLMTGPVAVSFRGTLDPSLS
jgi:diaminopimelate epimerase